MKHVLVRLYHNETNKRHGRAGRRIKKDICHLDKKLCSCNFAFDKTSNKLACST